MASLSAAVPDGWGAAVYDATAHAWTMEKRALPAGIDETFASIAPRLRGSALIAHIRARPARDVALANTHPFKRGSWVFAHSGTIDAVNRLRADVSRDRLRECEGDTDSELLFAHLLTALDRANAVDGAPVTKIDGVISDAIDGLVERRAGTMNFLLSDGDNLWAHRFGGSLYLLERRGSADEVAFASEPLTDEPWLLLGDATLVRARRGAPTAIELEVLRGADPRLAPSKSDIELPFTD